MSLLVRSKVHGKEYKHNIILKKYISKICSAQKVLVWADLGYEQKYKDMVHTEKMSTIIFFSNFVFFFTYNLVLFQLLSTLFFQQLISKTLVKQHLTFSGETSRTVHLRKHIKKKYCNSYHSHLLHLSHELDEHPVKDLAYAGQVGIGPRDDLPVRPQDAVLEPGRPK
jgi:hypothetical protein